MKAKEYLLQIQKYDTLIKNRKNEIDMLRSSTGMQNNFSFGREKVQVSKSIDRMEESILDYTESEERLKEDVFRYWEKRSEIIRTIEQLETVEYDVLYKVYALGWKLQEVADFYDRTYSWTTTVTSRALKNVQMILDKKE